ERPSPCPPAEPLLPCLSDAPIELPQTAVVRGPPIVLVMAAEFRVEGGLLPFHGVVAMGLAPFGDSFSTTASGASSSARAATTTASPSAGRITASMDPNGGRR